MISKERTQYNYVVEKNYLTIDECLQQIKRTNNDVAKLNTLYGTNYKLIKLNGVNKYAKVSNEDYIIFSKSKWFLNDSGHVVNEQYILMCDLIIKPTDGYAVEYCDEDKLNIVRPNLKIANYKKILLKDNKNETLVNIEDYDWLSKSKWRLNDGGYVVNSKKQLMHRLIMKPDKSLVVDHINSDQLDNRKEMLKNTTQAINAKNKLKSKNVKSSKYKGVSFYNNKGKYYVRITIDSEEFGIGCYLTEEEAAFAYDMYVVHNDLKEYSLNFPKKRTKYLNTEYVPPIKRKVTSEYNGVSKNKKKYIARICYNKIQTTIIHSYNELECAQAYDKYIVDNKIPDRPLNFPDDYPGFKIRKIKTFYEDFEGIINKGTVEEEIIKLEDNVVKLVSDNIGDKIVLIDKEDYEKIKYRGCSINMDDYVTVNRYYNNGQNVFLHRLIMNFPAEDMDVDHMSRNKFDNRKTSLKVIPHGKNSQNISKQPGTSLKYTGVSNIKDKFGAPTNMWSVQISNNYNKKHIGRYDNEEYAGRKRDLYIKENFPNENYNNLNFKWTDEDIIKWREILKMDDQ